MKNNHKSKIMKREKHIHPAAALIIIIIMYLLISTLEPNNIREDQQSQIDCMVKDMEYSLNNNR